MCEGISLNLEDVPLKLFQQFSLRDRTMVRGSGTAREIQFLHRARPRYLPAWHHNRLQILPWGNSKGGIPELPCTCWIDVESFVPGNWQIPCEKVFIPANLGYDRGIWYQIREGITGIVVGQGQKSVIYMLTETASHYYRTMTRHDRMPLFCGERI